MKIEINKKKNNHGIALASVLIVMALIGLLASSILNLSYLAYQRKLVENKNTENFYAAEAVLDSVKALLQNAAAVAIDETEEDSTKFAAAAKSEIEKMYTSEGYDNLRDYLYYEIGFYTENMYDSSDTDTYILVAMADTNESVYVGGSTYLNGNGGSFSVGEMVASEDGTELYIKDVKIKYVNNEGYTAEISTDIVIKAPTYASDEDVPVGTYTMFAGNGLDLAASSGGANWETWGRNMNTMLYVHQEGNVYVGSKLDSYGNEIDTAMVIGSETDTSLYGRAADFLSIGGTNVVFNGDVIIANGNTLIFTGGDGTEQVDIQVNGYIYLYEGATLLLPPNCNLVCKGIKVVSGGVVSDYTGQDETVTTVSQFYPFTEDAIKSNVSSALYSSFASGDTDAVELIKEVYSSLSTSSNFDERYWNYGSSTTKAGIYVLEVDAGDDGWEDRSYDTYHLVKRTINSDGTYVWNYTGTSDYFDQSMITCDEDDEKLERVDKVEYNGTLYDHEFAEIVNLHIFSKITLDRSVTTYLSNYSIETSTSYKVLSTWKAVQDEFGESWVDSHFGTDVIGNDAGLESRKLYVPTNTNIATQSYTDTVTVGGVDYNLNFNSTRVKIGNAGDNLQLTDNKVIFYITQNNLTVRSATGYYVGLCMSAKDITFGANTGVCIGISLMDLAEELGDESLTYGDLTDKDNPIHKYLVTMGQSLDGTLSEYFSAGDTEKYAFLLVDNVFNGGISVFWDRSSATPDPTDSPSSVDNSDTSFVGTENWSKD